MAIFPPDLATAAGATALDGGAMLPELFRIDRRRRETADTWTLDLRPESGDGFAFRPGQFTMVYAWGVGEVPISICGDPGAPDVLVHTIREVGAVTRAICAARPGDVLGVRGPFGTSWPVDEAVGKDVVIVAGGIGLPPLRPALLHVLANRRDYGRVSLLYGARTPADLVFPLEVERLRGRPDVYVDVTVDAAVGDWPGKVGVVPTLVQRAPFDPEATVAMIVGPEIMMRYTVDALVDEGVPTSAIYVSLERTMKCGAGLCGHCQLGTELVCRDGPVYRWDEVQPLLGVREL